MLNVFYKNIFALIERHTLTFFPAKTNVSNITSDTFILSITVTSSNVIAIHELQLELQMVLFNIVSEKASYFCIETLAT